MAEEQLRNVIEGIRAKLQAELESQLGGLAQSHEQAVHDARQRAEADAEQRWSAKLETIHAQWGTRLESELTAARAEVERALAQAVAQTRTESEQAAAAAAAQARRELEEAVATERARAQADLERAQADRERAQADLQRAQADLERAQADRERAQADRQSAHDDLQRAHTERERVQEELKTAQVERERTQQDLQRAHSEHQRTQEELRNACNEREKAQQDFQAEREKGQQVLQRAHSERERAHEELKSVQAEREKAQQDLQAERQKTQQDLQRAHADHERAQQDLQRAQAERERTQEDLQRAHGERERAQQDLQRAHAALEGAQSDLLRAQAEVQTIRQQAARELEQTRQRHEIERASAANALADARQAAESMPRDASSLLISLRAIDEATSLTEALAAAVRGAALESPRAALFIVNGTTLQEWSVDGVPPVDAGPIRAEGREAGFLTEVLETGETVSIDGTNGHTPPMFAGLSRGRRAIAVPFVLDGAPVAVLYADEGSDGQPLASWLETVQILGRHAASVVASLTAVRTARAMGFIARASAAGEPAGTTPAISPGDEHSPGNEDEAQAARRYAKLLVSEIKLYNEGAVRVGQERRDLRTRLREEIDRARRLYEQRISTSLPGRETYFQQELVQTLADGDRSLFE
jgi:hypothetical protein